MTRQQLAERVIEAARRMASKMWLDDDHYLLEALAAYDAALDDGGWQLIDTAPKDGTAILLWDGRAMYVGVHASFNWDYLDPADKNDGYEWMATVCSPYADFRPALVPTHWRPLPPPPRQEEE